MNARSLSDSLTDLLESQGVIRVRDLVYAAGDRAFGILLIVLALPSALPIPATGISTPLGLGMMFVAVQMMMGRRRLWLPERILSLQISRKLATRMIQGLRWVLRKTETWIHPRLFWVQSRPLQLVIGTCVAILALLMQIPIPLTNTVPAMVVFGLALSLTEDDGLLGLIFMTAAFFVITFYLSGLVAILFFGFSSFREIIYTLQNMLGL